MDKSKHSKITMKRRREGYILRARKGWTYNMLAKKWGISKQRARVIVGPVKQFEAVSQ
jgi:hypothetical protein